MATEFWLPEQLRREEYVERQIGLGKMWTRILQSVDPDVSVVFVKPTERAKSVGLEPGRWHVRKRNRGVPDSYMPILGEDGAYREPDQGVLNELGNRHMWRTPGVGSDQMAETAKQEAAADRAKALQREQLKDDAAVDFRAARRTVGDDPETSRFGRGKPKEK